MRSAVDLLLLGGGVCSSVAQGLGQPPSRDNLPSRSETVELQVSTKSITGRNDTAPFLYGLMFEDINHSGDGGIYAELIVNRAFQGSNIDTGSVSGIDGNLIVSSENPIFPSNALQTVLQVDIPLNATGEVGIVNYGELSSHPFAEPVC
jgi:alpha-L-arabinofuranosidase